MPKFFLTYPNGETVTLDDFFDIKRTIDRKGNPTILHYQIDGVNAFVDFSTGRFYINELCICPADEDGVLLTNKKVEYRPVWFRRWYRTFDQRGGEIDARWIIFLGWQFTENGRNHKRMMQIHQDGTVGIG